LIIGGENNFPLTFLLSPMGERARVRERVC